MNAKPLNESHLKEIAALQPPGWRPIVPVFEHYARTDYCHPVGVFHASQLIGAGCAIRFASSAWVGHVITHLHWRRRGVATAVMHHILDELERAGISRVSLIATAEGYPLYSKLGFRDITRYAFYSKDEADPEPAHPSIPEENARATVAELVDFDASICGEERSQLIAPHASDAVVIRRDDEITAAYLPTLGEGLIEARRPEEGLRLLADRLRTATACACPMENEPAAAFLRERRFRRVHEAMRMQRGPQLRWDPSSVYSRIGGNLG